MASVDTDLVARLRSDADRLRDMHLPSIAGTLDVAAAAIEDLLAHVEQLARVGVQGVNADDDPGDDWDDSDYEDL